MTSTPAKGETRLGVTPQQVAGKTMKASGLPDEMLNQALPFYRFTGLRQIEAEALMGGAIAAAYFEDGGEILLLTSDGLEFAVARLARCGTRDSDHRWPSEPLADRAL